jgi:hypothetical protein
VASKKGKRFRQQQQFWLDLKKPEEAALSQEIARLKADREFVATVRQGIALVASLRQGDLSLLDEMFPQAVDEIFQAGVDSVAAKSSDSGVEEKLTALASMVEGLSSVPNAHSGPNPLMVSGNLRSLAGSDKPLPIPQDDDGLADLLQVKDVSSESGGGAGQNLINSMLRMQQVKSDKPAKPSKSVKRERQSLEDMLEIEIVDNAR